MSKVMSQMYLGSDLEFMQELLGEDPAYDKFLNKLESDNDNVRNSAKAESPQGSDKQVREL